MTRGKIDSSTLNVKLNLYKIKNGRNTRGGCIKVEEMKTDDIGKLYCSYRFEIIMVEKGL